MKRFILFPFMALLVVGLTFCVYGEPAAAQAPIKIGILLPFTGHSSSNLEGMKAAVELKYEEINKEWLGRPVELIIEDSGSDPTIASDKSKKMVESDKVHVVIGPLIGSDAVAAYLTKSRTPNIPYMGNASTCLEFGGGNVFMPHGTMINQGYYMGDYLGQTLGYKTMTTLHDDFVAGEDFITGAIKAFEAAGGKSIQRQRTPPGGVDYSANVVAMKQADVVVFWLTPASAQRFLQQYYSAGLKMPLAIPCCNVVFRDTLAMIGDAAIGMLGNQVWSYLSENELNKKYVAAFKKKTGKVPEAEATAAYVAMSIFLEAAKNAKGDTSPDAIIDALHKIKVDTPAGRFSFTSTGLGIADLNIQQVVKVEDGYAWKNIKTYSQIPMDIPTEFKK